MNRPRVLLLVLALAVAFAAAPMHAQKVPPPQLLVTAAVPGEGDLLVITGLNFGDSPLVSLNLSPLELLSATRGQIVAILPPGLQPGTYLLGVSRGTATVDNWSSVVALGAAGPKGDKGDAGEIGPQGPTGSAGATGGVGLMGPQGIAGPQGPAGTSGIVGATEVAASIYVVPENTCGLAAGLLTTTPSCTRDLGCVQQTGTEPPAPPCEASEQSGSTMSSWSTSDCVVWATEWAWLYTRQYDCGTWLNPRTCTEQVWGWRPTGECAQRGAPYTVYKACFTCTKPFELLGKLVR